MLIFVVVLAAIGGSVAYLARDVGKAIPEVGKDAQGDDPWNDPIGVELLNGFQIGHIPDCAAGPVVRIILMDPASRVYWQVSGPTVGVAMTTFVVGATPKGFQLDVPLRKPRSNAVLRLVVIRKVKGAAGVRYQASDLRKKRIAAMLPITRFTISGFQTADVCGAKGKSKNGTTGTTLATGLGP
jgi:hypothetical protein